MRLKKIVKSPTTYMYLIVAVFSIVLMFPIIWTFITSLKSLETIFGNPLSPRPSYFLHNYIRVFGERPFVLYARNSLLVTVPTVILGQNYQIAYAMGLQYISATFEHQDAEAVMLADRLLQVAVSLIRV